jgi:hypothetical protein
MSAATPQNLSNHVRFVPGYHFVLSTLLLVVLGWQIMILARHPGVPAGVGVVLAVSLVLMFAYIRSFAVGLQDRIIRLEERLRMAALLPPDLQGRIPEYTPDQLVALRFASDRELPALARRVLDEQITTQAAIKKLVSEWRGDYLRV